AFRQQEIAKHDARRLEAINKIEHLRNDFEAIADIEWGGNDPRVIAESRAEHLPEVALFGLGGDSRRRAGTLTVDHHYRGFYHRRHAQAFAHQGKTAAGGCTHS